jgi:hypothetical protein
VQARRKNEGYHHQKLSAAGKHEFKLTTFWATASKICFIGHSISRAKEVTVLTLLLPAVRMRLAGKPGQHWVKPISRFFHWQSE